LSDSGPRSKVASRIQGASPSLAVGSEAAQPSCLLLGDEHKVVLTDEAAAHPLEYFQGVTWRRLKPLARYWFDALIIAGLGVGLAEVTVTQGRKHGPQGPLWFDILVVIGMTMPLFARRRFPFGAPVTAGIAIGASSFVDNRVIGNGLIPILVTIAGFVLLGLVRDRTQAIAGLAFGLTVSAIVIHNDPYAGLGNWVFTSIVFTIPWGVGFALAHKFREAEQARQRAVQAEQERVERARLAVADERARIARELHDVVGHSVSVMTVQASAARRLLRPHQEKEREALLVVEQTGREALAEMRRMVGVLRRPEEAPALAPQPSLEHLDKLVKHSREVGLPVDLRIEGTPVQLSAGIDLTAYRIVQEGLTNALKHARAERAEVVIRYDDGHVHLTVSDDGLGGGGGESSGHGLVGMKERVSVYGGEIEAGPLPGRGYRLHARLPIS